MRILVAGAGGFIGRALTASLYRRPETDSLVLLSSKYGDYQYSRPGQREAVAWHCDITDEDNVKDVLDFAQPEIIFHLAANPIVKTDDESPVDITLLNVVGTHNLLAHCKSQTRFVFASSATVYGNLCSHDSPLNSGAKEFSPTRPTSVYGVTKLASENLIQVYDDLGTVSGLCLRLVANVGGGATHGLIKDIIRKLREPDETITLLGDRPGSKKPFLHVDDTVSAFLSLGFNPALRGIYNISPSDSLTVEDVAYIVMREIGIKKDIVWSGETANWAGDNKVVRVCSEKAGRAGFSPLHLTSEAAIVAALEKE